MTILNTIFYPHFLLGNLFQNYIILSASERCQSQFPRPSTLLFCSFQVGATKSSVIGLLCDLTQRADFCYLSKSSDSGNTKGNKLMRKISQRNKKLVLQDGTTQYTIGYQSSVLSYSVWTFFSSILRTNDEKL